MDKLISKILFTAGPTERIKSVTSAEGSPSIYMRTDDFREFTKSLESKVKSILNTDKHKVLFVSSSGTGVMDMAVNSMRPNKALVVGKGTFSSRWKNILDSYGIDNDVIEDYDKYNIYEKLRNSTTPYDVVFFTLFETSECYLDSLINDKVFINTITKEFNCYTVVDSISGAVVNYLNSEIHDVVITSSQKGFGVSPGLSLFLINERAEDRYYADTKFKEVGLYFRLEYYLENNTRGSTPWTPPTSLMYALDKSCNNILSYSNYPNYCYKFTEYLFSRLKEEGLVTYDNFSGNCVLKVDNLKGVNSSVLISKLRDDYNFEVAPSGSEDYFRVGIYNIFDEYMIDKLVEAIVSSINDLSN